jgi:hypothetical protein
VEMFSLCNKLPESKSHEEGWFNGIFMGLFFAFRGIKLELWNELMVN